MSHNAPRCDCSIVVVALVGGDALKACLASVASWQAGCLVVLGENMEGVAIWGTRFPAVRFAEGTGLSVPMRRQKGVQAVPGQLVALLEDTSLPDAGWLDAVCAAFSDPEVAAVAGPVRINPALGGRFRALACTEYGKFHPGSFSRLATGALRTAGMQPVSRLPGNNLAYRREQLDAVLNTSEHGLVEGEVNAVLVQRGFTLLLQPRMAVLYAAADRHGARLATRLQHGRLYAGSRAAGLRYPRRLAWSVATLLVLPWILCARSLASMTRAVEPAGWPATALWICAMEFAWSLGESVGYLAGAGRSMEEWR